MWCCLLYSFWVAFVVLAVAEKNQTNECKASITTASGTHKPGNICSGALIFEDNFDYLDDKKWNHESMLPGAVNGEFEWYTNNRSSSFTKNGNLLIKPLLTYGASGKAPLTSGIDQNGGAPADARANFCPVQSARMVTASSFSFRYGRLVIRAKMPTGDWLWPALWLMPRYSVFGGWPRSGEIDLIEARGNAHLTINGVNIGVQEIASTLNYGTDYKHNRWDTAHAEKHRAAGYNTDFHTYELIWTDQNIRTSVDGQQIMSITPPNGGFYELGQFAKYNLPNPWKGQPKMAPYNQEFFIILNMAIGGNYFPDNAQNPHRKPWRNYSPTALQEFWNDRNNWLSTWNLHKGDQAALEVDYVRVYAI